MLISAKHPNETRLTTRRNETPPKPHLLESPMHLPTTKMNSRLGIEIGLLVLLSLIWGSSFTWIKVAVATIPPLTITAVRLTVAAVFLAALARWRGYALPRDHVVWRELFVQGLLQSALPFTLLGWGSKYIPSGLTGVLNATPPMFVLLIAFVTGYGAQHVTGQKIVGVCLGLLGVVVIIGIQSLGDIQTSAGWAQAAVLGASLCYALASILGRRFAKLPAIVTATGAMTTAAIMIVPAAIVIERPWTLMPSTDAIAAVMVLAVICTALAMVIYFRLVKTLGPLGTTSGGYLRAGSAVALGIIFLGENFDTSTLIGMTLIAVGVVAVTVPIAWPSLLRS